MRVTVLSFCCCMLARVAGAQIAALPAEQAAPHMVRAAGMPLNDGALAPGMLTVRIVEGAFTRDLADRLVTVTVEGQNSQSARTGADGRAQFAHVPIGARVRTSATVGTEQLESDSFEMPAASGVRILLVASGSDRPSGDSVGAAGTGAVAATIPWAATPPAASGFVVQSEPRHDGGDVAVTAIRAVLATTTVLALVAVWLKRRPQRAA